MAEGHKADGGPQLRNPACDAAPASRRETHRLTNHSRPTAALLYSAAGILGIGFFSKGAPASSC